MRVSLLALQTLNTGNNTSLQSGMKSLIGHSRHHHKNVTSFKVKTETQRVQTRQWYLSNVQQHIETEGSNEKTNTNDG